MFLNSYLVQRMTKDRVTDTLRQAEKSRLARELDAYVKRTTGSLDQEIVRNRRAIAPEDLRQDLTQRSR